MTASKRSRKASRPRNTTADGRFSNDPAEINIIISCAGMLLAHAENRHEFKDLSLRRDAMLDAIDRSRSHSRTSDQYRCNQVLIAIRTLFAEVAAERIPTPDFTTSIELADYLITKLQTPDEIDTARGYVLKIGVDDFEIVCCKTDEECAQQYHKLVPKGGFEAFISG